MELSVTAVEGAGGNVVLADAVFDRPFNEGLVHQMVVAFLANARQADAKQKTRTEVRGGGRKPWKQKGSGRARAGSIRSPLWRGGGKVFPAGGENYSQKLNKKMYRAALRSILAELVRTDRLIVVEDFSVEAPKTKELLGKLNGMGLTDVLIVSDAIDENLYLAARNLPHVDVRDVQGSDPVSLIAYEKVLVTVSAVKKFEELRG